MDAIEALTALAADPEVGRRLVHLERLPARSARHGEPADPLHPEVAERLAAWGIERLWTHQAEAVDRLRSGRSVALSTGTASGKSLCYQVPIVESALEARRETALLLFPTKALAHDQLRSLRSWLVPGLRAVTYDGDTPPEERAWARRHANVVLTNPDMLHVGILPFHDRWATFLMRLRYVVVDELHTLRGIFGSHVAYLLRRLRRVCRRYGSDPAFCFASATIGNPAELASTLCGLPVEPIDDDGSPRGERLVALWDRPLVDPDRGVRPSSNVEAAPSSPDWWAPACGRSPSPGPARAPSSWPGTPGAASKQPPRSWPGRWPPTAAGTCPRSVGPWSRPWRRAIFSAWPPPTLLSSASTWPAWTP